MSDELASDRTTGQPSTPPDGYRTWNEYWMKEHSQPWRTEPEIDGTRQQFLASRRAIQPNTVIGVYPFKGIGLDRGDIEWLVATHESGGAWGPVWWEEEKDKPKMKQRQGLDLRGASLRGVNLQGLPLARMTGGFSIADITQYLPTLQDRQEASVNLSDANLSNVHLEGAVLVGANFLRADLYSARLQHAELNGARFVDASLIGCHLEGTALSGASLEAANLQGAWLDMSTKLSTVSLSMDSKRAKFLSRILPRLESRRTAKLEGVRWNGADLTLLDWSKVRRLGDEQGMAWWMDRYEKESGTRANRQLAIQLRQQGLNDDADRFAYRAQVCRRGVLLRRFRVPQYLGSLFLDVISGYGYRPMRSFITYVFVILVFAASYFALGNAHGQPLTWNEAIVVSMTAFHGRGFFAAVFQPGDLQSAIAAGEAFIGLLIEIVLIATFTQRFFAR